MLTAKQHRELCAAAAASHPPQQPGDAEHAQLPSSGLVQTLAARLRLEAALDAALETALEAARQGAQQAAEPWPQPPAATAVTAVWMQHPAALPAAQVPSPAKPADDDQVHLLYGSFKSSSH